MLGRLSHLTPLRPHPSSQIKSIPPRLYLAQRCWDTAVTSLVAGFCSLTRSKASPFPLLHVLTVITTSIFFHRGTALTISLQGEVQTEPTLWEPTFTCIPPDLPSWDGRSLQTQKTTEMWHSAQFIWQPQACPAQCWVTSTVFSDILLKILYHLLEYWLKTY